jgi:hypothetical protein
VIIIADMTALVTPREPDSRYFVQQSRTGFGLGLRACEGRAARIGRAQGTELRHQRRPGGGIPAGLREDQNAGVPGAARKLHELPHHLRRTGSTADDEEVAPRRTRLRSRAGEERPAPPVPARRSQQFS